MQNENRRSCSLCRRWIQQLRLLVGNLADRLFEPIVKSQAGIYRSSQRIGVDQAYEEKLIELIEGSTLDAVLLLTMDYPYDSEGKT